MISKDKFVGSSSMILYFSVGAIDVLTSTRSSQCEGSTDQ